MIEHIDGAGIAKLARRAAGIVARYGEAAIFYRTDTKVCAALSRTDPKWEAEIRKHGQHLVGVYAANASGHRLAQWIEDDMREHQTQEAA